MNYLNPNELNLYCHDVALFDVADSDAGSPAFNHPRPRVESITERIFDLDRTVGGSALELFTLMDTHDTIDSVDEVAA